MAQISLKKQIAPLQIMHWEAYLATDLQIGNQSIVAIPSPLLAYKSYIDVLLGHSKGAKESFLASQLYMKEPAGTLRGSS